MSNKLIVNSHTHHIHSHISLYTYLLIYFSMIVPQHWSHWYPPLFLAYTFCTHKGGTCPQYTSQFPPLLPHLWVTLFYFYFFMVIKFIQTLFIVGQIHSIPLCISSIVISSLYLRHVPCVMCHVMLYILLYRMFIMTHCHYNYFPQLFFFSPHCT